MCTMIVIITFHVEVLSNCPGDCGLVDVYFEGQGGHGLGGVILDPLLDFSDKLRAPDGIRMLLVGFPLSSEGLRVITSFKLLFNSINKVLVVIEKINNLLSSPAGTERLDDGVFFRYFLRHCVGHSEKTMPFSRNIKPK